MPKAPFVIDTKTRISGLVEKLGDIKEKLDDQKVDYSHIHREISKVMKDGRVIGRKRWKALIYTNEATRLDTAVVKRLINKYVPPKLRAKCFKEGKASTTICITPLKSPKWKGD
jgi:hypothetical protein